MTKPTRLLSSQYTLLTIPDYYGEAIVLLAGIKAWYIRQCIITNAKNTRLALFSHRNTNPKLSINNLGELH